MHGDRITEQGLDGFRSVWVLCKYKLFLLMILNGRNAKCKYPILRYPKI